jgi:hypothetical protein
MDLPIETNIPPTSLGETELKVGAITEEIGKLRPPAASTQKAAVVTDPSHMQEAFETMFREWLD